MRYVDYDKIVRTVEELCISAAHELPEDVLDALKKAAQRESNPKATGVIESLIENAEIAKSDKIPLCQDTGLAVVFVEQGADVAVKAPDGNHQATLDDAINDGVKAGEHVVAMRAKDSLGNTTYKTIELNVIDE